MGHERFQIVSLNADMMNGSPSFVSRRLIIKMKTALAYGQKYIPGPAISRSANISAPNIS
jgi:hypothetical protein